MKKLFIITLFIITTTLNPVMADPNSDNQLAKETVRELILNTQKEINDITVQAVTTKSMKNKLEEAIEQNSERKDMSLTFLAGGVITIAVAGVVFKLATRNRGGLDPFKSYPYLVVSKFLGITGVVSAVGGGAVYALSWSKQHKLLDELENISQNIDELQAKLESKKERLEELLDLLESK